MSPYISLEAPSLKLFSSSAEVVKIFQPLKAIPDVKKCLKKGYWLILWRHQQPKRPCPNFFPIKENVASEMEYSLA